MKFLCMFLCALVLFGANFEITKKDLKEIYATEISSDKRVDFYCQEPFSMTYSRNTKSYKLRLLSNEYKNKQIHWEHLMSAYEFAKDLPCWKKGGRRACKKDSLFNQMEGDAQNIVPAIAQINQARKNYRFDDPPSDLALNQFTSCQVYIDKKHKKIYPATYSKGYIARSYIYMIKKYGVRIDKDYLELLLEWDRSYPASTFEKLFRTRVAILELLGH